MALEIATDTTRSLKETGVKTHFRGLIQRQKGLITPHGGRAGFNGLLGYDFFDGFIIVIDFQGPKTEFTNVNRLPGILFFAFFAD
jgi:hypothetical protein